MLFREREIQYDESSPCVMHACYEKSRAVFLAFLTLQKSKVHSKSPMRARFDKITISTTDTRTYVRTRNV